MRRRWLSLWGLRANGLTAQIPGDRDDLGRLEVGDDLKVAGMEDVYATGDVAHARVDDAGNYALMSCQHARTMGKYAGLNVVRDLTGAAPQPYRQADYTTCLDLGNFGAVFTTGWDREVQTTGAVAKERKTMINTQWIYPPTGTRRRSVCGAAHRRPGTVEMVVYWRPTGFQTVLTVHEARQSSRGVRRSVSSALSTLPTPLFGRSSTKKISRGSL